MRERVVVDVMRCVAGCFAPKKFEGGGLRLFRLEGLF
jgi:hypothetical protein